MTTTLLLVRHGETEWNHLKRAQGTADVALNDAGRRQALELARRLRDHDVVAVYSSDLSRARDTARPVADQAGLDVIVDPRLREIDQGEWTGLPVDEIGRRWPELWGDARHYARRPGGESPAEVRLRGLAALRDIVRAHPEGAVVVVSHGGTIRWLSAEALGYDDLRSARIRGLGNGGIVSIRGEMDGERLVLGGLKRLDGRTTDLDDPND